MSFLDAVRKLDMFKQSVYLTFNGRKSYATILGTFMTFIAILLWTIYGGVLLSKMWNRTQVIWNTNTYYIDLSQDEDVINLTKDDPKIKITYYYEVPLYDTSPGNYTWMQHFNSRIKRDNALDFLPREEDISPKGNHQYSNWSDSFPLTLTDALADELFSDVIFEEPDTNSPTFCPNLEGYKLVGSIENLNGFDQIKGATGPCTPEVRPELWGSIADISPEMFTNSFLTISVKNKFADLNDIDNPIKEHIVQHEIENATQGASFVFEVVTNEVTLEDSFWPSLSEPEPIKFRSIELRSTSFTHDRSYQYLIRKSDKVIQYKRQVLSFLEVSGIIGGIFELLEIAFGAMVGFYSSWLFKKDISSKFYIAGKEIRELKEDLDWVKKLIKEKNQKENDELHQNEGGEEEKLAPKSSR